MNIQNVYLLLMTFSALIIYIYHRTLRLKMSEVRCQSLNYKLYINFKFSHLFHPLFLSN